MTKKKKPAPKSKFAPGKYTVIVKYPYLIIKHADYPDAYYQLKLEDEGLVLDAVFNNSSTMESLFHCMNSETFVEDPS